MATSTAMAAGTHPWGNDADGSFAAIRHHLQHCHQCFREGTASASSTRPSGDECRRLSLLPHVITYSRCHQCLREGTATAPSTAMATRRPPFWRRCGRLMCCHISSLTTGPSALPRRHGNGNRHSSCWRRCGRLICKPHIITHKLCRKCSPRRHGNCIKRSAFWRRSWRLICCQMQLPTSLPAVLAGGHGDGIRYGVCTKRLALGRRCRRLSCCQMINTYSAAVSACGKTRHLATCRARRRRFRRRNGRQALVLLATMLTAPSLLNVITCSAAISAAEKARQLHQAALLATTQMDLLQWHQARQRQQALVRLTTMQAREGHLTLGLLETMQTAYSLLNAITWPGRSPTSSRCTAAGPCLSRRLVRAAGSHSS